ncbi:unnamed protein product [Urochloa decumbens]|uniref:Protein kinase domain-containing protein n=1 Tax=Urochloa decumbens TaxID=240449 RepID=A0ABC9AZ66_9POAL
MADPLAKVDHISQLVLAIKKAMETVRRNEEECADIQQRILRIKALVSILEKSDVFTQSHTMSVALQDLSNAVSRALDAVIACQQSRNNLCRFCVSLKQARKLRQVKADISETMMVAMFAANVVIFVKPEGHDPLSSLVCNDEDLDPLSEYLPASSLPSTVVGADRLPHLPAHVAPSTSIAVADLPPHSPEQILSHPPKIVSPTLSRHLHPHLSTQQQKQPSQPTSPISKRKPPYPPTDRPSSPPFHPSAVKMAPLSKHMPQYQPTQPSSPPPRPPLSEHLPSYYLRTQPLPHPIKIDSRPPPKHLPSHPPTKPSEISTTHPTTSKISPPEYLHPYPIITQSLPPPHPQSPPVHLYIPSKTTPLPGHVSRPQTSAHLPHHSPTKSTSEVLVPAFVSSALSRDDIRKHSRLMNGNDKSEEKYERKEQIAGSSTVSSHLPGLTEFSLSNLKAATHDFSNGKIIGSSDICTVYEGQLHDGVKVTIKKFRKPAQSLVARWRTELHLASKLQSKDVEALGDNKYIIRVLGYGHESLYLEPHIFLVEEYMPNGNMGDIIYGSQSIDWSSRFGIIQGLAHGLHYIHGQNIVHMNLKPDNILLDSDMNPKITDFGIARMLKQPVVHDDNISGTLAYMPPEYMVEGILSIWYDVYSFGVTLLETISGMCRVEPARHLASVPWAWNVRKSQQMGELFESSLFEESQLTEIKRCLEIGLLCTEFEWATRPTMADVLDMLNGKKGLLRTPKRPEYTKERGTAKEASQAATTCCKIDLGCCCK